MVASVLASAHPGTVVVVQVGAALSFSGVNVQAPTPVHVASSAPAPTHAATTVVAHVPGSLVAASISYTYGVRSMVSSKKL